MLRVSQKSAIAAKMPFLPLCIAFTAGILAERFFSISLFFSAGAFSALAIFTVIAFFKKILPGEKITWLFLLLFFLMGTIRLSLWKEKNLNLPYQTHLPLQADSVKISVISVEKGLRTRAVANLQELRSDSVSVKTAGKLLIYFPYQYRRAILPGQVLYLIDAGIDPLPEPRNPGQFDYDEFLRWRGIIAQCKIEDSLQVFLENSAPAFSLENRFFYPLRQRLVDKLEYHFPPSAAGFLKALLLGAREDLSSEVIEDFQKAGVMHVLAISGLHVGFVALIFYIALSFFPIYFKRRNILVIFLLICYMFLTGNSPPVVRATLMAAFYFLAINLERKGAVYNYLFAAAFIILLFQPQQLFWSGFQFSFAAVLSIVYFYGKLEPPAQKALESIGNEKWRHRLRTGIVVPLLISLAAQLGTVPLVMHYFHILSLVSFLLNIVVIPYIGIIVALGFLFLLLSFLSGVLAELLANFLSFLIGILIKLVSGAANLPGAYLNIPAFGALEIFIYLSLILLLFNLRKEALRRFLAISAAVLLAAWGIIRLLEQPALNLLVLDVGQGDSALLTTPAEKVILIDTGPANDYHSAADAAIIPAMQHLGIKTVNYLFISHPHLDHLGGTFRLLQYAALDSVFLPPAAGSYYWNDTLLQVLDRSAIPHRFLKTGDRVEIDPETRVYVLGPFPQLLETPVPKDDNLNNNSLVLLLKHRDHTVLFAGDAEAEAEIYLQLWREMLKSDFLKVGHHGSNTSTTEDFLAFISPQFASISSAENNKFGHPSPKVLRRLSAYGSEILRTDRQKAIWMRLKKGRWERVAWE